jgi:arsenite oxidase small subunit
MKNHQSSRRGFLKAAVATTAVAATAPSILAASKPKNGSFYGYEDKVVGLVSKLKSAGEMDFNYPDADSPCKAVVVDGKIKAYSLLCTHKGCPIIYNASQKLFRCPCHFSEFDAELNGQMTIGQATENIPEILVKVEGDNIIAYGVNGLIYGRESNIKG